jgi:thiamine transport system permease protein
MAESLDGGRATLRSHSRTPKSNRPKASTTIAPLLLWLAPLAFLGLFYFYPLSSILQVSFARSESVETGLHLSSSILRWAAPFGEALTTTSIQKVIGFTIWQAFLSTILTLLFGLPGAYLLARYEFRGKSLIQALAGISFVLPALVVATAFNALLGPRGWLNLAWMQAFNLSQPPFQFLNSIGAILIAHVFYNTTIVLRMVGDFWSHLDPRTSQAAQVLGANRWQTLYHVTLPLLMPAIIAAALLVFIFDFTSFGVILILGGPRFTTLEVEIYNQTISLFNLPLAAALSVVQLVFTLGLTTGYTRLSAGLSRPLSLRPRRFTQRRLLSRRSRALASIYVTLLLCLLTLPLLALAARSFTGIEIVKRGEIASSDQNLLTSRFTLDFYRELFVNRRDSLFYVPPTTAIAVSLGYATATVLLSLSLGLPASWALARDAGPHREQISLNKIFDPILMLPLGTSAVTLGLGFIVALDRPPLDLRASPLLIPLAHTLVAFPFVVRSLTPALRSIRPRLRQAAAVMGASPFQVYRYIDLPLVGRALAVAATFAFTISLGEFGATALISRPEYPTIPVMIYRFISQPGAVNYGQALALSTLLMSITACGMLAIENLRIADVGEF